MNQSSQKQKIKVSVNTAKNNSSVSEFIKRSLPTEHELEEFEEIVEEKQKHSEIDDSLSKIYQDDDGNIIDARKIDMKKKHGFLFWFFSFLVLAFLTAGIGHGIYYYLFNIRSSDATTIEFTIQGNDKVMAGEEFFWTIHYKNLTKANFTDITIKAIYPENFIFLESAPKSQDKNFTWHFNQISANEEGDIKIKGKIIGPKNDSAILLADITYIPENFTSTFKKEASFITSVKDIGIDFNFEYSPTALMNEKNDIVITLKANDNNFLQDFFITTVLPENIELISLIATSSDSDIADKTALFTANQTKPNIWHISNVKNKEQKLEIKYKVSKKNNNICDIALSFGQTGENEQIRAFLEKKISVEITRNNLSLTLIINELKNDSAINFGQKLNYSIVYANKGEVNMKNIMVMAVLEGDFFDWSSLDEKNNGIKKNNTITWSQNKIPGLAELKSEQEGIINFSINAINFKETDLSKKFQVKSYVQFNIGKIDEFSGQNGTTTPEELNINNRSNIIINKINSDFSLQEEARYFDKDNIPVGVGPLPFKAEQTTSLKVYWTLINNLHELRDAKIEVDLPYNVNWNNKNRVSVGSIQYDNEKHKVIWQIGRLPITVYKADAEFSISVTPTKDDIDKIMILLPGSNAQAVDNETGANIVKTTKPKTTKLENDETAMGISDGRVVE